MFMIFLWFAVVLAGSVMQGHIDFARTALTAGITATSTTIPVRTTTGFPDTGIVVINDERIAYSAKTTTPPTFVGSLAKPIVRGTGGTTAAVHNSGAIVATVPGAMMNTSADYNIAVIADSSGGWAAISTPLAVLSLIGSFFILPLSFLGTDLQILTMLWAVLLIGMLIAIGIALAGSRRI